MLAASEEEGNCKQGSSVLLRAVTGEELRCNPLRQHSRQLGNRWLSPNGGIFVVTTVSTTTWQARMLVFSSPSPRGKIWTLIQVQSLTMPLRYHDVTEVPGHSELRKWKMRKTRQEIQIVLSKVVKRRRKVGGDHKRKKRYRDFFFFNNAGDLSIVVEWGTNWIRTLKIQKRKNN